MAEYINREDALKCLEYNTIQKPSANDVVSATLRVAREKVEKLPVAQEEAIFSFWRDPDKDPPKVEEDVLPGGFAETQSADMLWAMEAVSAKMAAERGIKRVPLAVLSQSEVTRRMKSI